MKICNYEAQCILMNMKRKFNEYEALKVNITRRSLRGPGGEVSRIIGWDTNISRTQPSYFIHQNAS
jgi:hypothetical protein